MAFQIIWHGIILVFYLKDTSIDFNPTSAPGLKRARFIVVLIRIEVKIGISQQSNLTILLSCGNDLTSFIFMIEKNKTGKNYLLQDVCVFYRKFM